MQLSCRRAVPLTERVPARLADERVWSLPRSGWQPTGRFVSIGWLNIGRGATLGHAYSSRQRLKVMTRLNRSVEHGGHRIQHERGEATKKSNDDHHQSYSSETCTRSGFVCVADSHLKFAVSRPNYGRYVSENTCSPPLSAHPPSQI